MPQVTIPNAQLLGSNVYAFADSGDPNTRSDPQGLLAGCALGSTYQRTDGPDSTHCFYVKTSQPAGGTNYNGVWTAK